MRPIVRYNNNVFVINKLVKLTNRLQIDYHKDTKQGFSQI